MDDRELAMGHNISTNDASEAYQQQEQNQYYPWNNNHTTDNALPSTFTPFILPLPRQQLYDLDYSRQMSPLLQPPLPPLGPYGSPHYYCPTGNYNMLPPLGCISPALISPGPASPTASPASLMPSQDVLEAGSYIDQKHFEAVVQRKKEKQKEKQKRKRKGKKNSLLPPTWPPTLVALAVPELDHGPSSISASPEPSWKKDLIEDDGITFGSYYYPIGTCTEPELNPQSETENPQDKEDPGSPSLVADYIKKESELGQFEDFDIGVGLVPETENQEVANQIAVDQSCGGADLQQCNNDNDTSLVYEEELRLVEDMMSLDIPDYEIADPPAGNKKKQQRLKSYSMVKDYGLPFSSIASRREKVLLPPRASYIYKGQSFLGVEPTNTLYDPVFIRKGPFDNENHGWCDVCGKWMQLRNHAYAHHFKSVHGISQRTKSTVKLPKCIRGEAGNSKKMQGYCDRCRRWIDLHHRTDGRRWQTWYIHQFQYHHKEEVPADQTRPCVIYTPEEEERWFKGYL